MTTPNSNILVPPSVPEQDTSHIPPHDPGTDHLDPDAQGIHSHPGDKQ